MLTKAVVAKCDITYSKKQYMKLKKINTFLAVPNGTVIFR